jgi:hypothetical protein
MFILKIYYRVNCKFRFAELSSGIAISNSRPGQTACDVTRKAKRQNLTFVYIFRKYQIRCFNHSYGKL